jgi:hypothetical protein
VSKVESITLHGPFDAWPTNEALRKLGYPSTPPRGLPVYRVDSTRNTLAVNPGHIIGVPRLKDLIASSHDVHVKKPADREGTYLTVEEWLEHGGKRGEDQP